MSIFAIAKRTVIAGILTTVIVAATGCAENNVEAGKIASLPRGIAMSAAEHTVQSRGGYVFDINIDGDRYQCSQYRVGRAGNPYFLVYRNGALLKVARVPGYRWSMMNQLKDLKAPEYLWIRATEIVFNLADIASPPDEEPPPKNPPNIGLALIWIGAFSPFIVTFGPVLGVIWTVDAVSTNLRFDPARATLGDSAEKLDAVFGPVSRTWDFGAAGEWRRYQTSSLGTLGARNSSVEVLLKDGRVIGIFSDLLLDDIQSQSQIIRTPRDAD